MADNGRNTLGTLLIFVAGAAAGAAVALLTAPRSGRETREKLREYAKIAGDKATRLPEAVSEAATRGAAAAKESFAKSLKAS
jgi:gas vesicle protein